MLPMLSSRFGSEALIWRMVAVAALLVIALQAAASVWAVASPGRTLGVAAPAAATQAPSVSSAAVLTEFDPFFRKPSEEAATASSADLGVTLYAMRVDADGHGGGVIAAGPDGVQRALAVGEEMNGLMLKEVRRDAAVFSRGGVLMEAPAPASLSPNAPGASLRPAPEPTAETASASETFSLDALALAKEATILSRADAGGRPQYYVSVVSGGAALGRAGLQEGDVLVSVNGASPSSPEDVKRALATATDTVSLTIERSGARKNLVLKVRKP